jgi:hypothetical protein
MSEKNYPLAWNRFVEQSRDYKDDRTDVFIGDFGTLSRWAARFRLAKSFKGIDVGDAYTGVDTPQMYSAIVRIFLVYSSFETYCKIFDICAGHESEVEFLHSSFLERQPEQKGIISEIRNLDKDNQLFQFLANHLSHKKTKGMMENFIRGGDVNVSFLAKSMRHVFAHGVLTANSGGLSPKRFDGISQKISDFLLDCMDSDFDTRIPEKLSDIH